MASQIGLAVLLSVAEFFSESIAPKIDRFHSLIKEFNAGLMIGFLFLFAIPELAAASQANGSAIFVFFLLGFALFHLLEEFLYRHTKNKKLLKKEIGWLHVGGFYVTGVIEGMALFFFTNLIGLPGGEWLFLPLLLNSVNASVYMSHLTEKLKKAKWFAWVWATGPLVGFGLATLLPTMAITHLFFALITGTLLYVVCRDALPAENRPRPWIFAIGVALSVALLLFSGFW